ncbi:MAG: hypothetical protein ABIE14_04265 [Patescibacteria group bacterium]
MNSPTITIPLNKVQILDTIGSYQILKVPKKFGAKQNNLPVKKLKPAVEKRLAKIRDEALRDFKAGRLRTFDNFLAAEYPELVN